MSYKCWICNATDPTWFSDHKCFCICDNCMAVLNSHFNEAIKELQEEHGTPMNELLEAFEQYAIFKGDEYNEQLRKERKKKWQK